MKTSLLPFVLIAILLFGMPVAAQTWVAQTSGTTESLYGVAFTDANNGWAVGYYGTIKHTTNGGTTWTAQTSGTGNHLIGVAFTDANNGWAVGNGGTILHTTNGGANWVAQTSGTAQSLYGVSFADANNGWAAGNNGTIRHTTNGGTTWSPQTSGTANYLFGVAFTDANNGWAVGNSGTIVHTTNGGATWVAQTSGTTNYLRGVAFTDANNGWAVGDNGTIRHTTNGGTTWSPQTSGTANYFYGVAFPDTNNGWAVGNLGTIVHTTNGGAIWVAQTSGTSNLLLGVAFTDANNGWVVGISGSIVHYYHPKLRVLSPNGGERWVIGTPATMSWTFRQLQGNVTVALDRDYPSTTWETLATSTLIDQPFTWMVTGPVTESARVRVISLDSTQYGDTTDNNFSILNCIVSIVSPSSGDQWPASPGQNNLRIIWNRLGQAGHHVAIYYHRYDSTLVPITTTAPDTGSFPWTIPTTLNGTNFCIRLLIKNAADSILAGAESGSFSIDNAAPTGTITLVSPGNGVWTSGKPQFCWSDTDLSDATNFGIWVDGSRYLVRGLSIGTACYQVPDSLSLLDGMHTWTVRALDDAGNFVQASESRSIRVDATPPALFNLLQPADSVWTNDNIPIYQWSPSSDGETGLAKYRIYVDSQLYEDNISGDSTRFQYGTVFQDNMESGTSNWNRQVTWGLTTSNPHGGMNSMTDSPGSNYSDNQNTSVTKAAPFNLSGATSLTLRYYFRYVLELNYDYVYVEISQNASSWTQVASYTGTQSGWALATLNLNGYTGWPQIYVRFRLQTDATVTADGFYFDDFQLDKGGATSLSDGHHTWYVNALDSVGNTRSSTQTWNINVDTTPPSGLSLHSPANSIWTRDSLLTFDWNVCADNGIGMDHYEVWIDGANISGTRPPTDTTYTLTPEQTLPNGDHIWYVKAFDLLGNVAQSTLRTIRIDRIPPSPFSITSVGGIAHDSALVTLPTPTFVWSATTDAGCGLSHYEIWIDSLINRDNLNTTSAGPADPLTEGYHSWFVVAVDNQGNRQVSTQTWRVIGDWNLPTQPLLVSPINHDTVGTSRPLMSWSKSTDAGSGVGRYLLYIDGTVRDSVVVPIGSTSADTLELRCRDSLINGDHNWYVKAIDRATNQRSSVTGYFYALRDITPPTSQITSHTSGQWAGGDTIHITGTAQDNPNGSGVQRVDISFDDGNTWYPCLSNAPSLIANRADEESSGIVYPSRESTAPEGSRNARRSDISSSKTGSAQRSEQSVERSVFQWQFTWTGFSTATYSVRTRATDFENNVENPPSSCTINIDRTPPGIQSFSASPNPAAAGLVSVSMTFSTGAHSGGMNLSDPPLVTFNVTGSDTVVVVQTNYSGNTWTGQATIAPTQANGTARFTVSGARDNLYNLFACDTIRTFVIDTHPPLSFSLISPADSSWTNNPQFTLAWGTAVDTVSGIGHYELEIDGSTASPGRSYISAGQTTSTPAIALTLGGHSWRIKAVDVAGNSAWSTASYRISVDLAVPVSTIISPPNGATIGGQCYTITGTSTDGSGVGASGVDYVEIKIDNGAWQRVANTGTNYSTWSYEWCGYTNGSHTLRSRAIDHATNTEVPALQNSITVDLNPPVVRHPVVMTPSPCRVGPITATVYFHANPLGMNNAIHPNVWFTTAAGDSHAFTETSWSDTTWIGGANIIAGDTNGSATVHVTGARDAIGNNLAADHSAGTFIIDTHAPAVTQTACSPRITNVRNDLTVQINFAETVSGLNTGVNPSVRILPSSGGAISVVQSGYNGTSGVWTGTAIISSLTAEGSAGISIARAVDNAGNVMDSVVIAGRLIIDRTPPLAFDMITPVNDEWLAQTRPFFTWHRSADAVSGLQKYQLYINGELNVDNISPSDTSAQGGTPLADGAYNWRVAAVDSSNPANIQMAGTSTRLFHVDNSAPVSGVAYPLSHDSLHGNSFTVTGTANDGLGISAGVGLMYVLFSDNGGLTWDTAYAAATPVSGTVAWQYSWHGMTPGAHTLKSKAIDGLGNVEIPGGGVPVFIYGVSPDTFALSAPANSSNVTTTQVLLMWTASSDPDSGDHFDYVVQWSARSNFLTYLSATTTATQYLISDLPGLFENLWERRSRNVLDNLPDDTTVYWRVKAVDNLGNVRWATPDSNGWSFHVSIPDMPRVFTLISPVNGDTNRTLSLLLVWHRTTDPDPASNVRYDVWMDTTSNLVNRWQLADSLADTSFVVPCLLNNHTYYWTVRATDNNTAGRWATDTLMLRTIRPAVGSVAATDNRCDSIVITWNATVGADSFRITRDGIPFAGVPGTVLRYADAPSPGSYQYTVLGLNLCGLSPAASDSGRRLQFPGIPAGLQASDDSCSRIHLTWMMPTGNLDSVQVLRNGVQIASVTASAGTYIDHIVGSYAYQVRSHSNACGNSAASAVDSGFGHAEGGVPTGLTAGTPDCDQISFSWTQSAGDAQRYYVYRDSVLWDSTTALSYTDTLVSDATWHSYHVSAWNPFCGESMWSAVLTVHAQYLVALAMPLPDTVACLDTFTVFLQHCSNVLSDSFFLSLNGGPFEFAAAYAPVQDSIQLIIPHQEQVINPNCRLRAISHRAARTDTVQAGPFVLVCPVNVEETSDPALPTDFVLAQNYPNPFNPTTTLRFGVPHDADVRIDAYDVLGRHVAALWQGVVHPGFHEVAWNCAECATGVYIIRMQSSNRVLMRKIMLLK